MANGWNATDNYANVLSSTGIVTDLVISKPFPITANGAKNLVLKVGVTGVTQVGTMTIKLQSAIGDDWVDSKTTTFTADGKFYIKLNIEVAGDQTFLPLLNKGRVVVTTTNAGDIFTVASVQVLQCL